LDDFMPLSPTPSTDLYDSGNIPSVAGWQNAPPADAFGSAPAAVNPQITAPQAVSTATQLGKGVYSQLPGYGQDISKLGANIKSEIGGKLPADVITQLTNEAAARGIGTGTGAAGVNQDLLKTLGLTSLNLTQMGQSGLNAQLGMLPGASLYQNPGFYPSSAETLAAGQQNAANAAAPNPQAAAQAALRAAGAGYAAGSFGSPMLPGGAPSTVSSALSALPSTGTNLAMLNDMASTYFPGGSTSLVTGDTYGGGPASLETQIPQAQLDALNNSFYNPEENTSDLNDFEANPQAAGTA
jgi:hypothetical protein